MNNITTCLFDFDGVVVNTEPLYDKFWGDMEKKYHLGIPDLSARIKGTTLEHILATYFSHFSIREQAKITEEASDFELQMDFPLIPGVIDFLHLLKEKGYRVGLVTSSSSQKMEIALQRLHLDSFFDTVVTAARITRGKPDPMCYLLAADDLGVQAHECVVFEDAFAGIQAATAAQMKVIGLATTNPEEAIRDKVCAVICDFSDSDVIWRNF